MPLKNQMNQCYAAERRRCPCFITAPVTVVSRLAKSVLFSHETRCSDEVGPSRSAAAGAPFSRARLLWHLGQKPPIFIHLLTGKDRRQLLFGSLSQLDQFISQSSCIGHRIFTASLDDCPTLFGRILNDWKYLRFLFLS